MLFNGNLEGTLVKVYHTFASPFTCITNPLTDQSKTTAKSRLILKKLLKKPLSISRSYARFWILSIQWCLSVSLHEEKTLLLNGFNAKLTLSKMVACLRCHSIKKCWFVSDHFKGTYGKDAATLKGVFSLRSSNKMDR